MFFPNKYLTYTTHIYRDAAEAKKADVARKKAEKDALLAAEEKTLKAAKNSVSKTASSKKPNNKTSSGGTLDLTQLDTDDDIKQAPLNASGIDNALDALSLTTTTATNNNNSGQQIDRHPERRYKAAYAAYEARRLPELEEEFKGLRRAQRIELVKKEFEKAPENPFNMVSVRFDASREEVREVRERERRAVEERLTRGGGAGGG